MREIVKDRVYAADGCIYGDEASQQRAEREREDARRRQTVRFAVAPGRAVRLGGRTYGAGSEVTVQQIAEVTDVDPGSIMVRLVSMGAVLEASREQLEAHRSAQGARYLVARGQSLIIRGRGIVTEGAGVFPRDFPDGELQILDLIDRGLVVEVDGPEPQSAA